MIRLLVSDISGLAWLLLWPPPGAASITACIRVVSLLLGLDDLNEDFPYNFAGVLLYVLEPAYVEADHFVQVSNSQLLCLGGDDHRQGRIIRASPAISSCPWTLFSRIPNFIGFF